MASSQNTGEGFLVSIGLLRPELSFVGPKRLVYGVDGEFRAVGSFIFRFSAWVVDNHERARRHGNPSPRLEGAPW
jgi:hypothetical protein